MAKYRLSTFSLETNERESQFETIIDIDKSDYQLSGKYLFENQENTIQILILEDEIHIKNSSLTQRTIVRLPFDGQPGEHLLNFVKDGLNLSFPVKLLLYEYNNTHFVIEYIRFFEDEEKTSTRIEVEFNV